MLASKYNLPFTKFIEPDNFNQMTAFGFIMTPECCMEIEEQRRIITLSQPMGGILQSGESPLPSEDSFDNIDLIQFLKYKPSAR